MFGLVVRTLLGVIIGISIGITIMTLLHILGWPLIGWALTRLPPATPHGWAPKHRTWQNGIEEPWQPSQSPSKS